MVQQTLRKKSADRPQKRWLDDIRKKVGRDCHQMAHNKEEWKTEKKA